MTAGDLLPGEIDEILGELNKPVYSDAEMNAFRKRFADIIGDSLLNDPIFPKMMDLPKPDDKPFKWFADPSFVIQKPQMLARITSC